MVRSRGGFSLEDHFTVVCSVAWPLNGSKTGGVLRLGGERALKKKKDRKKNQSCPKLCHICC